jgi:hypothetical protein
VGLVEDDNAVLLQARVEEALAQKHAVREVLDHRLWSGAIFKADVIPHLVAHLHAALLGHATRHGDGRHTAGLRHHNRELWGKRGHEGDGGRR